MAADRVRAAAAKLGYVPDPAARALASAHSTQVVVLVPTLSSPVCVDLLEAVHRTLWPAGFQPLIGVTHHDPAEEERLLHSYLLQRPAGLILTGFERSADVRHVVLGRAEHHLGLVPVAALAQQFQKFHPAHHGHVPIEQDHVGHLFLAPGQGLAAVAGLLDLELQCLEDVTRDLADHLGVIDDEAGFHEVWSQLVRGLASAAGLGTD